ncbi:MAG: zf-HC2 domain-containing protein [Polyangiaceae bacterium]
MDCDKFDQHVIDALYDELDELTMAAMKRHMEGCSRCAGAFSALRATRQVAVLPLEEPSEELESRILFAASAAQRRTPWHRKALRALAWAGSHAMRPQLAMAAVFVLVIGSSLLLLRAKPGTTSIGPVRVTERGEPSPDRDDAPQAAAAPTAMQGAAPSAVAASEAPPPPGDVAARGEAAKDKDEGSGAAKGKSGEAQTALADAKATEGSLGCDAALPKYDDVATRFAGTSQAADAMWAAASCHKKRGDMTKARELYGVLAQRDEYKQKAEDALNDSAPATNQMAAASAAATANSSKAAAGGGGKAGVAAPVAAPAPKAASKPATIDQAAPGYGGSRSNASPVKSPVERADRNEAF